MNWVSLGGKRSSMDITIIVTCKWSQKDVNLSVIIFHFGNLYIILIWNWFQSFMISYEAFLLQNMLNHDFWTKCHKNSGNYLV